MNAPAKRVLVTGGGGYLGRQVVTALAQGLSSDAARCLVSLDVREVPAELRLGAVIHAAADIRDKSLVALLRAQRIDTVVHLAAIVTPGKKTDRDFEYQVDVEGTRNVLQACTAAGVRHVVISSSGAAYGYHADNPAWLSETDAIRGNHEFPYSLLRSCSGNSRGFTLRMASASKTPGHAPAYRPSQASTPAASS